MPEVHMQFVHTGGPASALRAGTADVALLHAPFDDSGLDTELLFAEPRVAVLPAGHRLARRRSLRHADLAGEPVPRWAKQTDTATAAYWANGTGERPDGPEISDMNQLLDVVALGQAVAYVPASIARHHGRAELVFVPVADLSPSEVVVAWPDATRSRAVADFVHAAVEVAADHRRQAAAFA